MKKIDTTEARFKTYLTNLLIDKLGVMPEEITNHCSLSDDLGMDSLDAVELCMEIEKEWNIEVNDEDIANAQVKTFQDVVNYFLPLRELRREKLIEIENNVREKIK